MPFDRRPLDRTRDPAADPLVSRPHRVSPPLMLAGMAGACLLGAGLGLWARPSDAERELAPRFPAAPAHASAPRQIEIRVDRPPVPPVLTEPAAAPAPVAPQPPAPAELLAPKAPPEGLMRVHAVAPERLAEAPIRSTKPNPTSDAVAASRKAADLAARKAAEAHARANAARKAEADRKAAAAQEARAEAKAAAARKARRETARIAAAESKARDKAERRLAERQATERRLADQKAEARKRTQLAEVKAAKLAKAAAATRLAEAKSAKTAKAAAARRAEERSARLLQAKAVAPHPAKPVRLAQAAPRCASSDPGAALACADPALGAADRQLGRAYRQAQAAGVSQERLERQQQRWLAARANAARQAPWAVHDIYLARIAELQDQTRQASHGRE